MLFSYIIFILLIIGYQSSVIIAQVVNVPLENSVYNFLERQNLKGNISLNDEVKPYPRVYIAEKLVEIRKIAINSGSKNSLSKVDLDELKFYEQEYFYEISKIKNRKNEADINRDKINLLNQTEGNDIKERWFLFSYADSLFNLKISPIAGYETSFAGNKNGHARWVGLSAFSTYSDWFGASFDLRDKGEFGDNVDREKSFSAIRGAWYKGAPNGIEYSDVKGSIAFNWEWGNLSLAKDYQRWGHGNFGQLIISDKAPSYPQIRLQLNPVKWLRFYYMHGWLNSLVPDSAAFYYSYPGTISERIRKSYISKYIAANMITVTPWKKIDISAGNAIIYSGDLRPEFFIPFMFYKFLDHNSGRGDVGDGNGMMYFDISAKYPDNFKFYTTLFIDVTEIRNILDGDYENTWIGFTAGGKTVDLLIPNLDLSIEYTRLNPWVYEHKDETTNYKHIDYTLGHWLGQNSDQIRVQFDYQLIRGLRFKLFAEQLRKGGSEEIYYAYNGSGKKELNFLFSPVRKERRIGIDISYEYMHDLSARFSYVYSNITDESERPPLFLIGSNNIVSFALYYSL